MTSSASGNQATKRALELSDSDAKKQQATATTNEGSFTTNLQLRPTEKICSQCKATKSKEKDYYKKQRCNPTGVCKCCWDIQQREAANAKVSKRQKREETLRLQQGKDYRLTYGVGYHWNGYLFCDADDVEKHRPTWGVERVVTLENPALSDIDSLVGDYKVIFYRSSCDEGESISRTAQGSVRLRKTHWDRQEEGAQPVAALCGEYRLLDSSRNQDGTARRFPDGTKVQPLGEILESCFIQNVVDWDDHFSIHYKDFIIERSEDGSAPGICRCLNSEGQVTNKFWNDGYWGDLDFATLRRVTRRIPLALRPDELSGFEYSPSQTGKKINLGDGDDDNDSSLDLETALARADAYMTQYNDTSASWLCRHLDLPSEVALRIREFAKPKPVIFFQEGDLILSFQETAAADWWKDIVFRKIEMM